MGQHGQSATPMEIDVFLEKEVGGSCGGEVEPRCQTEEAEDDDEYQDIDWCTANEVPDAVEAEAALLHESQDAATAAQEPSSAAAPAPTSKTAPSAAKLVERQRLFELRREAALRHQVLALCFAARLQLLSEVCDDEFLQAAVLSMLPAAPGEPIEKTIDACLRAAPAAETSQQLLLGRGARRRALLQTLSGHRGAAAGDRSMILVARCRAEGRPARLAMMLPLPPARSCASLLSSDTGELPQSPLWAEVFDEHQRRWLATGAAEAAAAVGANLDRAPWILAASEGGRLFDATRRYVPRWTSVLAWRGSLTRDWDAMLVRIGEGYSIGGTASASNSTFPAALSAAASAAASLRADLLDEKELAKKTLREPLPCSRAAFKRHLTYVLDSQLRQHEIVHPPGQKPAGLFRGKEPVWRRVDIAELKTPAQWRREERIVREGEQPQKVLRGGSSYSSKLFGLWQTEVRLPGPDASSAQPVNSGPIPCLNSHGNVELLESVNGVSRPPFGTVHVAGGLAEFAATQLGLPYAAAVVGFTRERGQAKPRYNGVVVWANDELAVREAVVHEQQRVDAKQKQERDARFERAWRLLVKSVLVDHYVEEKYRKTQRC